MDALAMDPPRSIPAFACDVAVPMPSARSEGGWARRTVRVSIPEAGFPVACTLPGPGEDRIAYRHGEGRFWLPVPAPSWMRRPGQANGVGTEDLPILLSGHHGMAWPDNPFLVPGAPDPAGLPPSKSRFGDSFEPWNEAGTKASAACADLRLVEGVLHRAVPEPYARLDLIPAGSLNALSVSYGPWERPSSRRVAFPLHRFPDLLVAVTTVPSLADGAVRALEEAWPEMPIRGIYGPCPVGAPRLATPPNLAALPPAIVESYACAQSLGEHEVEAWDAIAGAIAFELLELDEADPAVAHGAHWVRTELTLPLLARRWADVA